MKKLAALFVIILFMVGCAPGGGENSGTKTPSGGPPGDGRNWVKVVRVVDGDTFEIINRGEKEKVRLIGVDTPESVKPGSEVEPFGIEAGNFTKKLIEGRQVRLEFDVQERDRYGRLLAYVYLEDGALLNARLLEEGLAAIMTVPPNVRMAETFLKIQKKAREEKKGIWK